MQTKTLSLLFAATLALGLCAPATAAFEAPADAAGAALANDSATPAEQVPAEAQDTLPPEAGNTPERMCRPAARHGGHPTTRQKRAFRRPCHNLDSLPVSMAEVELIHQRMYIEAIEDPAY